ncbi:ankyrin repeat domain-containing protein [Leptothoe sp. PORK10 BA2]|uniref:ankyrin repeat domain-containing protein n=1 Tax=Leptothoe sp. PORK10 BA2 TaxID=3110254 RepID=UPI002B1FAEAD|nr:ankyrin repeat domain-containing protein [Leptothoe sp. PORK10 BA2]
MLPSNFLGSVRLKAYVASLLATVGTVITTLPLWAQSTPADASPSAFCQLIEGQGPFLDADSVPANDDDFRDAIAQGGLDQPCNVYGERWQPLNFLIASQSLESQTLLIQAAVAQGADVNGQDGNGNTPLHYASQFETVAQLLIDNGANVNATNNSGDTPLHNLYGEKSRPVMQLLLDQGADINARNQEQFTPLHRATAETVELLLASGADINARNDQNYTPLHYAVTLPAVAMVLIEAGADLTLQNDQGAPIHSTSLNPTVLTALLDGGVDVNLTNQQGETPLHRHRFNPELTQILIERGADVNAQDRQGRTPLFEVNIEVARQLVAAGADLTRQDHQGRTALHQAAIEENSFWGIELTELFLSQPGSEALLAVRDNNGETALDIAQRLDKTEIVNQLQAAEAVTERNRAEVPLIQAAEVVTERSRAEVPLIQAAELVTESNRAEVPLTAVTGGTLATLQQLLQAQDWAAADRETRRLLDPYSVSSPSADAAPFVTPAVLIRAIDQAWLEASDGHFGLSVQLRLWQAAQAAHPDDRYAAVNDFRDRIGWKIPALRQETDFISSDWRNESELTYSLQAPEGHLPWAGVSDAVVQDLAVPGPGEHCGSCTIDAMHLRDGRFYGRIPELMAAVATAMNAPADSSWQSPQVRFTLDLAALFPGAQSSEGIWPHTIAISPDSQLLAVSATTDVADYQAALALWNLTTGTRRITLLEPARLRAETLAFSPNGQTLWAGLDSGELAIWDTDRGALIQQWDAHRGEVKAIAFSRDGAYVYTGGADGTVKIWSPSGQLYQTLRLSAGEVNPGSVQALLISPNGRQLAVSTGRTIQLWGTDGRLIKVTTQITDQTDIAYDALSLAHSMAFSPDSRYFATLDTDHSVKLWNAETGARVITLQSPDPVGALAFTQDGQSLLVRNHQQSVTYWNLQTYERDRTLSIATVDRQHAIFLSQPITLSPDGQTFAVPFLQDSAEPFLWDSFGSPAVVDIRRTSDGERLTVLEGSLTAHFSPDNRWLVTQGYSVQIWSPQ